MEVVCISIYAISDIHGYYNEFRQWLDQLGHLKPFEEGTDTLVLIGDYIDGGPKSYEVLELVHSLSVSLGDNAIVLRGNHEDAFLEFIGGNDTWLAEDRDLKTVKTFLSPEEMENIKNLTQEGKASQVFGYVRSCIKTRHTLLLRWLKALPYHHETENQIFVHAGVCEEAEDIWKWGTEDYFFVGKFPPTTGSFYKDIIAGHTSAKAVSGNPSHEGIYWDGESHYFIDGAADQGGRLLCLAYNEETGKYYELLPAEKLLTPLEADGRVYGELAPL